jgi:hypothetical protein
MICDYKGGDLTEPTSWLEASFTFGFVLVIALRPQTPKHIRGGWSQYTDTSEPIDGGVGTLLLWTTRTILSVKMDRENSLTLLWSDWGSNPMPSDPQAEPLIDCTTGSGNLSPVNNCEGGERRRP